MSFYANLFSDSSCCYFSDNKPTNFTNFVHNKIQSSEEDFEVALVHITYTNGFHVLSSDADRMLTISLGKGIHQTLIIPSITYEDVSDLIIAIMKEISSITNGINIIQQNNCVMIRLSQGTLELSSKVSRLLGFGSVNKFIPGDHLSGTLPTTNLLPNRLYLTSDVIPSQIVGDKVFPVLRSFTNAFPCGAICSVDVEPYYVPVTKPDLQNHLRILQNQNRP
jgi:hypothetical protein